MTDYQISQGTIPDPINPGVIRVWSAFTPSGERIMNGESMFYETDWQARDACNLHMGQGRVAA